MKIKLSINDEIKKLKFFNFKFIEFDSKILVFSFKNVNIYTNYNKFNY